MHGSRTQSHGPGPIAPPVFREHKFLVAFGGIALIALSSRALTGDYLASVVNLGVIYAIAAMGFYIVYGLSGQFAFSQAAYFGLGAYVASWASSAGFWVSTVVALGIVAVVAAAFSLLMRRTSQFYFAIGTLGFSEIALSVFTNWQGFTGPGGNVLVEGEPTIFGHGFVGDTDIFWLLLAALAGVVLLTVLLERSPMRRDAIAVRDREPLAVSLGMPVLRTRIVTFVVGSTIGGFAGVLFAHQQGFISPESFGVGLSLDIFLIVILGGMRSLWGAVVGATFVVGLPEVLRTFSEYRALVYAVLLIATVLLLPHGLVGLSSRLRRGRRHV